MDGWGRRGGGLALTGGRWRLAHALVALLGGVLLASSLLALERTTSGLEVRRGVVGTTPVTVYRRADATPGPAVVIAHGFAGSSQLMQPFAVTLARAGYVAVTFDFFGHGRHPRPLGGSITDETGATARLVAQMDEVATFARALPESDGRLAFLGHSMATDIAVRVAQARPDVDATIAVAMFAPTVSATTPANLLVIVGDWEARLKDEALRVVALTGAEPVLAGVTYGDVASGTARRVVFAPNVEHVGVLYSEASLEAARDWLNHVFARELAPPVDDRGLAIAGFFAAVVLLAWPLAQLLPRLTMSPRGAGLGWRALLAAAIVPMLITPLALRAVPFHFLPVLVADYLVAHFALYGLLTAGLVWWLTRRRPGRDRSPLSWSAVIAAVAAVTVYAVLVVGLPLDRYVVAFLPTGDRLALVALMLTGTLPYVLADEWLTRGSGSRTGAYALTKVCCLLSLMVATALDVERLFFLLLIIPVIVLFFVIYGLFAAWVYRRTGLPAVGGLANALALAWAIAVTFPIVAG